MQLLTARELALIILLVLPIFLFVGGPVWRHPFHLDAAILSSYAPIPILVLLFLLRRRAVSLAGFLVGTVTALSIKYMLTTSIAFVLWAALGPPEHPRRASPDVASAPARHDVPGSTLEPIEVSIDVNGFAPGVVYVHRGQPVVLRSSDRSLHTVRGTTKEGTIVFNYPILPDRGSKPITFTGEKGPIELSCTVHEHEHYGTLVVLDD